LLSKLGEASNRLDMSPESVQREARILCHASPDDVANGPLTNPSPGGLPFDSRLLSVGTQPIDSPDSLRGERPKILFVSSSCALPRLELSPWITLSLDGVALFV
jgi:hypothetical protein